jgi:hypothetical protein
VSPAKRLGRRRGVWQRRFWEHVIRSEDDLAAHCDYIHFNPVKHGLARCPRDWPYSSFPRIVAAGDYDPDWGCGSFPPPPLARLGPTIPEWPRTIVGSALADHPDAASLKRSEFGSERFPRAASNIDPKSSTELQAT